MKPSIHRRIRRRSTSNEAINTNKETKQEQSFFGDAMHEPFFKPATAIQPATGVQRKCTDCEKEDKVQRAPDKKEEEKVMKKEEKKEEKIQRLTDKREEDKKVQRAPEKKEEEKLMKKEEKKEEEKVHKKEGTTSTTNTATTASNYIDSIHGKGQNMDAGVQSFYESRIGADFSDVKIHTGKEAADSAKEINAQAYAYGNHIVFNEGKYQPETSEGKHLLAHELAHVVQNDEQVQSKIERKENCITNAYQKMPRFTKPTPVAESIIAKYQKYLLLSLPPDVLDTLNERIQLLVDERNYYYNYHEILKDQVRTVKHWWPNADDDEVCSRVEEDIYFEEQLARMEKKRPDTIGFQSSIFIDSALLVDAEEILTPPQYNVRDELEFRRLLYRELLSGKVELRIRNAFNLDSPLAQPLFDIYWNGYPMPNDSGKITYDHLLDIDFFNTLHREMVTEGPTKTALIAMNDEIWNGAISASNDHMDYIKLRNESDTVGLVRGIAKWVTLRQMNDRIEPDMPPYGMWQEVLDLLLIAMDFIYAEQPELALEPLLHALDLYNDSVKRLENFHAADMRAAGNMVQGLYYIKAGSAITVSFLSGAAFAAPGAGFTRVLVGSSAVGAGYTAAQDTAQMAAGGPGSLTGILTMGVKNFGLNMLGGAVGNKAAEVFKVLTPLLSKLGPGMQTYIPQFLGGMFGGATASTADFFLNVLTDDKDFSLDNLSENLKEEILQGGITQLFLDGFVSAYSKGKKIRASKIEQFAKADNITHADYQQIPREQLLKAAELYKKGYVSPDTEIDIKNLYKDFEPEMRLMETENMIREKSEFHEKAKTLAEAKPVADPVFKKDYDIEIKIGEHTYRRSKDGNTWCRFSFPLCFYFQESSAMHIEVVSDKRRPRRGIWEGTPGNSEFFPDSREVLLLTDFQGIPFKKGKPDFSRWADETVLLNVAEFGGLGRDDHNLAADLILAKRRGWLKPDGTPDAEQSRRYRESVSINGVVTGLTWHHTSDKLTLQLIPSKLHNWVQHEGGFKGLRRMRRP